jgi:hypothetical protein
MKAWLDSDDTQFYQIEIQGGLEPVAGSNPPVRLIHSALKTYHSLP